MSEDKKNNNEKQPGKKRKFPTVSLTNSEDMDSFEVVAEIEDYQVIEELPRGGQAIVYKAIQKATKAKVALKVLPPGLLGSSKARHQFQQEVELSASLNHPNIVTIRDSGIYHGQYYFSMDYIHGKALDLYVSSKGLSFREKVELFCKICDPVSHAHQHGIIHRDLKPGNILVDERGEPHLLDFGLAKVAGSVNLVSEETIMVSITGQIKGTITYMSPEQAKGRSDLIDVRTDIYSLGVIFHQMLTGEFPYDVSGSMAEVLQNIQDTDPTRLRKITGGFDSDIETILLKTLEKDPSRRYQSVAELKLEIERWLQGLPIMAKSTSSIYLLRKIIARNRYVSTIILLLFIIFIGQLLFSFQLYGKFQKAQDEYQEVLNSLNDTSKEKVVLEKNFTFIHFLKEWRADRIIDAEYVATFLSRDSREAKATKFLLNSNLVSKEEFRLAMKDEESWFVEFVLAEYYLKNGALTEALKSYKKCRFNKNSLNSETNNYFINRARSMSLELESKIQSTIGIRNESKK